MRENLAAAKGVVEAPKIGVLAMLGLRSDDALAFEEHQIRSLHTTSRYWWFSVVSRWVALLSWLALGHIALSTLLGLSGLVIVIMMVFDVGVFTVGAMVNRRAIAPHKAAWMMSGCVAMVAILFHSVPDIVVAKQAIASTEAFRVMAMGAAMVTVLSVSLNRLLASAFCVAVLLAMPHSSDLAVGLAAVGTYVALVCVLLVSQAREDQLRSTQVDTARGELERARRLIGDHEAAGRGWFWETDSEGGIAYVSPSVAALFGVEPSALLGRPLTSIVNSEVKADERDRRTLPFHMSTRSSFSDLAVQAAIPDEDRWWSISGTPIFTEFGRFEGFRGSGTDLTEMRKSQNELSRLAQYDQLTGLFNRVKMQSIIDQALVSAAGRTTQCSIFLLDLDRFKSVNDTMGHPAGDALLRQVAKRLESAIGDRGQVGRLGGDEFQIAFPGLDDRKTLAGVAKQVIDSLSQPYAIEGKRATIGVSIGIAIAPTDGRSNEALVRNADLALYEAKDDGRGTFKFYAPTMHANAEQARLLENDLRDALKTEALSLAYQPVVSAQTERITGFEALLRWTHPIRGPVSPAEFIPIAEDAGMIAAIGEWALRTACQEAAKWPGKARVAVNVSPIQFANPAFSTIVANALANAQLPADRLELEITESVFLTEDGSVDKMFTALKRLGVRIALDDFGTGYSSLGYLKRVPFDKIKIDQSFVRGAAAADSRNNAIINAIVSMSEALQMETTAEGAETHDELDLIRSLGCSHVQGYIYGRPMPANQAGALLVAHGGRAVAEGYKSTRKRRAAVLRSVIVAQNGERQQARIRNISTGGALIEGITHIEEKNWIFVDIQNYGVVQATVHWVLDDRMGIEFTTPIDLDRFGSAAMANAPAKTATTKQDVSQAA